MAIQESARKDDVLYSTVVQLGEMLRGGRITSMDLLATKGIPTTWGSKIFAKQVFDFDSTVISRLRDAGAVLLGKLNMIELAGGTGYKFGSASATGATHNPC